MKHRNALLASIWAIAIGVILGVVGSVIGDMWAARTTMNYAGFIIRWAGIITLILAIFGVITTVVMEYLDKEQSNTP